MYQKCVKFRFDWHYKGQIYGGDFAKFCGLLRIYELYTISLEGINKSRFYIILYLILLPPYFIGFRRKEFRGKLAIAITANFKNKRTTAEAVVEEISGVAFVYKQDFFNNLYEELGIALENIVYYKDETHYFVMTTKKHSLLDRKVLKKVSRRCV